MPTTPLQTYSKATLAERLMRDLNNGLPDADASLSENEVIFHIDQAIAASLIGNIYGIAKVEGVLTVPEAYITTYSLSLIKDEPTGAWYGDLPQPPVSLPLGYSVTDVYFASSAEGNRQVVFPIEQKRVAYREFMKMMSGSRYWMEGRTIFVKAHNGTGYTQKTLYVKMIKTRTITKDEDLALPDDQIEVVYNLAMKKLRDRLATPQDIIQDGLPAGNKTS
jgi:hypothetical protein